MTAIVAVAPLRIKPPALAPDQTPLANRVTIAWTSAAALYGVSSKRS